MVVGVVSIYKVKLVIRIFQHGIDISMVGVFFNAPLSVDLDCRQILISAHPLLIISKLDF